MDLDPDLPAALGAVLEQQRGSLPFALLHGESLVAAAAWALGAADVQLVDLGTPWAAVVDDGRPLVLHDSCCPATPPEFLARVLEVATAQDAAAVGIRPVTDTVKHVDADGVLGSTLDRDRLAAVCSPLVLPSRVLAGLTGPPPTAPDLAAAVAALSAAGEHVVRVEAPPEARRVADVDDLAVLAALTRPSR